MTPNERLDGSPSGRSRFVRVGACVIFALGCGGRIVDAGPADGAVSSDAGSTIVCNTTTCSVAQICCFTETTAACVGGPPICAAGQSQESCDDPGDCASGKVCCGKQFSDRYWALCTDPTNCAGKDAILCSESSQCSGDAGLSCKPLPSPSWLKACQ